MSRPSVEEALRLSDEEIRIFLHNACRGTADLVSDDDKRGRQIAAYAYHLQKAFEEESKFEKGELAFVLVNVAYNLLYGDQ